MKKRLYVLPFLILLSFTSAQSQEYISTVLMNDDSIIKGKIIEDNEERLVIVTRQLDTLDYGYRLIKKVYYNEDLTAKDASYLTDPKFFKTEGLFIQARYGIPFSLEVGKRMNSSLYLGGQIASPGYVENTTSPFSGTRLGMGGVVGLSAYGKYYLSQNPYRAKSYIESNIGLAIGEIEGTTNDLKPYAGIAIGVHFPNRKKLRVFLDIGIDLFLYNTNEVLRNQQQTTVITSQSIEWVPQVSLIGLEF